MARASIFRLAAVLLLLLTGAELFACELLAPAQCESFGVPDDRRTSQDTDDGCMCCCTHVLVVANLQLDPCPGFVRTVQLEEPPKAERKPASIYHPPRN
jgi:hypothetical protein